MDKVKSIFKNNKKIILIGLGIWILTLALTISVTLVTKNKDKKVEEKEEEVEEPVVKEPAKNEYLASAFDLYNNNDLTIKEYKIGEDCYYDQISGLKDKKLQSKINGEIHDKAEEYYKKIKSKEDPRVYATVSYNANNLISFNIIAQHYDPKKKISVQDMYGKIIDLKTGEEVKLEDLFYDTKAMYSIISHELMNYFNLSYGEAGKKNINYKKVAEAEDKVFKAINNIKKGNYTFHIYDKYINVWVDSLEANINAVEYIDSVTFFKKYKYDASLYEKNNITPKNTAIFSHSRNDQDYYRVELTDNYLIDAHIFNYEEDKDYKKVYELVKIDENINKLVKSFSKDNFSLINISGYITRYDDLDYNTIDYGLIYCSKPVKYKNSILNNTIKSKTIKTGEAQNIYFDFEKKYCKQKNYTAIISKNKIITLDNLFKEGIDYKEYLKEYFYNDLTNSGYSEEQIDEMWNSGKIKFELIGGIIYITYDNKVIVPIPFEDMRYEDLAL